MENLDEGVMDFISKFKDKFLRLKDALSDEWSQTKEMWEIAQKGNQASLKEINFANSQFKDILRVAGLSAWYALPIPGNTLLILATEKLLNKAGMSIIPDKIRNQVLMSKQQGVTEDSYNGIEISMQRDDDEIMVRASAGGRQLGSVLFIDYDGALMPQDLEVDERYRGQGIAAAMYDYVKSLGYKIRRSGQQTDAGAGFWAKHRPNSNVWEQGVAEGQLDPYRLERLDPQTRRVLIRMGDHKEPGSWLSASEAYAMMLGLQYKNRDPRGWEQEVQHYVDLYRQYSGQGISEVKILSKVKGKGANPDQLPNRGREISPEKIQQLGRKVLDIDQDHSVYRDQFGGQITYNLFNTETNRSTLTVFGSRYPGNPDSFIVAGLYASPDNDVPAAEFYRRLITDLGLTLVSDRKQSPGGQRVWQRLEQMPGIEVHGYDTATGEVLNIGAGDEEMYAVPAAAAQGRDMGKIARDIRLVATAQ